MKSTEKFDLSIGEPETEADVRREPTVLYKVLKTLAIILVWIAIGLWSEINGATLPDLMYRTNTKYELISLSISMRGAGGLTCSILGGGAFVDKFHNKVELILAVCVVLCAGLNVVVAYSRWIELLFVMFLAEGYLECLVNIAGQVVIMDTWLDKASGPLHLIHLGYGAGSFIVPQIVAPFISNTLPMSEDAITNPACATAGTNLTHSFNSTLNSTLNSTSSSPAPLPSNLVVYGFWICSGVIVVISVVWFGYFFFDKQKVSDTTAVKDKKSLKEIYNPNTCSPGHPYYALLLYALLFFWIYTACAGERVFAKYLYSFAREQACFDKQEATNILSAFWISFTAGRFAGFVGSLFIPMKVMIFIEGIGNLASAAVLFFFGANKTVMWVCVCVSGVLIGPCYPSGLAWANRYMVVTATGVTVLSIGAGVGDLSFLPTIGYFIDLMGINVMTSFVLGFGGLVCALPIIMQGVACTRGDRFQREEEEAGGDSEKRDE